MTYLDRGVSAMAKETKENGIQEIVNAEEKN